MVITRTEENRNRAVSAGVATLVLLLFVLFLILFNLVRPDPPFPEGGGGGQELALGLMMGNDVIDYGSMGKVTDVVTKKTEEKIVTVKDGEEVPIPQEIPEKTNVTVITPVNPVKPVVEVKEKTAAEKLAEKFKKNTGKSGGGIGDNAEAGENGSPEGDPFKNGTGGSGTGSGGGVGEGEGPGGGPGFGGGKYGYDLTGRKVVVPPKLPTDTKEEGKVVVDITVDSEGNVIAANPNGRGTTTSSALLKAKARMAALATKFTVNGKFEEQNGTITIVFSFQ
jgi:periplasmic protein TonB